MSGSRVCLAVCVAGIAVVAPVAGAGTGAWDATLEFSVYQGNPNGAWSYGWMPVGFGEFTLYTNVIESNAPQWWGWAGDHTPCIWRNDTGEIRNNVGPGLLALHPGPGTEPSVLRWTAPATAAGGVRAVGRFMPGDYGDMLVGVRINGGMAWSEINQGQFDLVFAAVEGTTVDFVVYGGYGFGNTPLEVEIIAGDFCQGDYNQDGAADISDVLDLAADVASGGQTYPGSNPDFNGDGSVDLSDVFDLANRIAGGNCP